MDKELFDVLINWFPMLLLIAVWVVFLLTLKFGKFAKHQKEAADMNRRKTEALERIAAALEKQT